MKNVFLSTVVTLAVSLSAGAAIADPYDWAGPYVGLYYGGAIDGGAEVVGLQGGYNFDNGRMVYGVEVDYLSSVSSTETLVSVGGRAGVKVADNALLFAILGYGTKLGGGTQYVQAGIGAEYGFGNNIAARIGVDYLVPNSGNSVTMAKIGLTYGF